MNRAELFTHINELKIALQKAELDLENYQPTLEEAVPGDILEDGSYVLIKNEHFAVVVSSNEFESTWNDLQDNFASFKADNGYDNSWFIPNVEFLQLAYKLIPTCFSINSHWSSTEDCECCAYLVGFAHGHPFPYSKTDSNYVRAFKMIVF